jgi:hypothetical protein
MDRTRWPVSPEPEIIERVWELIGDGMPWFEAIDAALQELGTPSSLAEALPTFARANYLLDAPDERRR